MAVSYLIKNGYKILDRNYRLKMGEIDIIAKKYEEIHFVEVKYRQSSFYGFSAEAVSNKKLKTIEKCAWMYIFQKKLSDTINYHFDIISIMNDNIEMIEDCYGVM